MAVLKHIANKNADYSAALTYLLFQYDESKNPILDEKGRMLLREEYYLDGINCEPMMFDKECEILNAKYHKNQKCDEIKSHHYIISFDPKDKEDHDLTGERAQALGLEYAKKNFPGHQALVCTHTDGNNGAGNIHVHIIINSLRKYDVEKQEFMERPCDSRAGYKHHLTKNYLKHLQRTVMEMCQQENLYQIDLNAPAKIRITDKEYKATLRGQKQLDERNARIIADDLKPRKTQFQTQKDFIREAVREVSSNSTNIEDFKNQLWKKYQITLIDKRGRFSYHHPKRDKNISERALGTDFSREHLLHLFEMNKVIESEKYNTLEPDNISHSTLPDQMSTSDIMLEYPAAYDPDFDYSRNPAAILFIKSDLRLVVYLQNCIKAQQNQAYARKVKLSNLQQMAKTVVYIQEHGYDTMENLQQHYDEISKKFSEVRQALKNIEMNLKDINEQIHYTGQYLANKSFYQEMLKSKNKARYREQHHAEITSYESAVKFLKRKNPNRKIPTMKMLKDEKAKLTLQHEEQKNIYHYFKDYQKELRTVCTNVDIILEYDQSERHVRTKSFELS